MKKYLFILILTLSIASLKAQKNGYFTFTVYGEPQITWLMPDSKDVESAGSSFGFNGGLNFDKFFAEKYAFTTGISINKISGRLKYNSTKQINGKDSLYTLSNGQKANYNLQYIEVPIGLKFKTIEIGYSQFYAHLGLDAGINIKANADLPGINDVNVSEEINLFNLAYFIGGGIEYSIGGGTAIVGGITYKNGFVDVISDNSNKVTSGIISFRLGILF